MACLAPPIDLNFMFAAASVPFVSVHSCPYELGIKCASGTRFLDLKPLPDFAQGFGSEGPWPRPNAIYSPGTAIVAVGLKAVTDTGVTHALVAHVD